MAKITTPLALATVHVACVAVAAVSVASEVSGAARAAVLVALPAVQLGAWAFAARWGTPSDGSRFRQVWMGARALTSPRAWALSFRAQLLLGLPAIAAGLLHIAIARVFVHSAGGPWPHAVFAACAGTVGLPVLWALGRVADLGALSPSR